MAVTELAPSPAVAAQQAFVPAPAPILDSVNTSTAQVQHASTAAELGAPPSIAIKKRKHPGDDTAMPPPTEMLSSSTQPQSHAPSETTREPGDRRVKVDGLAALVEAATAQREGN